MPTWKKNFPLLYWDLDKQTYIGKYTFMSVFCLLNKEKKVFILNIKGIFRCIIAVLNL